MRAVAVLFFYQVLGELTVTLTGVPIPGAVIGMVLLFLTLVVRNRMPADLQETAQTLLKFLPVLFVPIGVGVMAHFSLLATEGLPILVGALLLSTMVTLLVSGLTMRFLQRSLNRGTTSRVEHPQ